MRAPSWMRETWEVGHNSNALKCSIYQAPNSLTMKLKFPSKTTIWTTSAKSGKPPVEPQTTTMPSLYVTPLTDAVLASWMCAISGYFSFKTFCTSWCKMSTETAETVKLHFLVVFDSKYYAIMNWCFTTRDKSMFLKQCVWRTTCLKKPCFASNLIVHLQTSRPKKSNHLWIMFYEMIFW